MIQSRRNWIVLAFTMLAGCVGVLGLTCGAPGPIGPPSPAGPLGPGTTVTGVEGGPAGVAPGSPFSVTFTLADDAGEAIDIDDLDRFSIYVSGPATNYQRVIVPEDNRATSITDNGGGSYTYAFAGGFPTTYAAPVNDSDAYDADDGELTGQAIQAGTYTVGIEARRSFTLEGETVRDASDTTFDFGVGGATVASRQVVTQAACEVCHNQMTVHGENRFSLTGCVLCHTNGAEDRTSADPAKATTGLTIQFANMIHRLHRGAELQRVTATAESADPYRYEVIGFGESVIDFSDVKFPFMPGGTGFNEQVRNCGVCHGGAAEGDRAYTVPSQIACTGCHDSLDFSTGTRLDPDDADVDAGNLTEAQLSDPAFRAPPGSVGGAGGTSHQFADNICTLCHTSSNVTLDPAVLHVPVLINEANLIGLRAEIQWLGGNSNPGFWLGGGGFVVNFRFLDRNNNPVDIANLQSVNLVVSGPVENPQKLLPLPGGSSTVALKGAGGVPAAGTGPFTYTSPTGLPATYPAPASDSVAFDFAGGWGELSGQALASGTYMAMVYAYRQFEFPVGSGVNYREASRPAVMYFRIGSAGGITPHPEYVTDEKCNACHGDLRFHGNGRRGVMNCVQCHVAGAEDRTTPGAGQTQDPAADTIDFKVMIHKIHYGRELDVVAQGGAYDLIGFGDNVIDFSTGILPTMPGEARHCTACHATEAYEDPVERADVNIWKVACTSCHDSAATAAHVAVNTVPGAGTPGTETCGVCHGPGAAFSVELSHLVR